MSKKFASPLCLGFAAIKSHLKVSPAKIRFAVNYARNTLCTILFSPEDLQSVKFCRSIDAVAFYEAHLSTYSVLTFMTRYTMANCCGTFILCKLPSWINGRTLHLDPATEHFASILFTDAFCFIPRSTNALDSAPKRSAKWFSLFYTFSMLDAVMNGVMYYARKYFF
ncbi:hypothetical protein QE152_g40911 [Popillia japonica]|uniref:Uncharacterized protein n=1 Tax=Popillia japonica TaxID=7064 RepID=A0AAW1HF01_POPJA